MVVKCAASWHVPRRMWKSHLNRTGGLQGLRNGSCHELADNDLGTGSGWRQSRQNQAPLAAMRSCDGMRCQHHCRALKTHLSAFRLVCNALSGRHSHPRPSRNLKPRSSIADFNTCSTLAAILQIENTPSGMSGL